MKLVIFDVDGTLVDSQHHIHAAMGHAFGAADLPAPPLEAVHGIIGLSLPLAIAGLAPPDLPQDRLGQVVAAYKDAFVHQRIKEDAPLFAGAADCLARLAARDDLLLGVATGKGRRGLDVMVANHGLQRTFVTLQCADDHPSKPHPSMVLAALAEAGVAAEAAVMVGDTTFDMDMARAAGVTGLGVGWGYHPPADLTATGAAAVVADFDALTGWIEDWAR